MDPTPLSVVQSCPNWLPITQGWLYEQIRRLPADIRPHVVCETATNTAAFSVRDLHAFSEELIWRRVPDRLARRLGLRRHLSFLARVARATHARVLHSHFGHVGWADRGAAAEARARHVVTFYGADISQAPASDPRWRVRYLQLFRSVDRVLCEGPHMRQCAIDLGCPPEKAQVHHLGIDVERIEFRPRSCPSDGPLRVLVAGTFLEKKGIPLAIEAVAALRARRDLDVTVTVLGDASNKPGDAAEKQRILEAIRAGGLTSRCRLLGFQPHDVFLREAAEHHVFLSPSLKAADGDTEGGAPISILEAAASGMPVVSTTHCDIPHVLTDRVSGVLAPERDLPALTAALEWLVDHPERWAALEHAAQKRITEDFDSRTQGERLAAIYRELASVPSVGSGVPRTGSGHGGAPRRAADLA
jgi:colanic acid/amylovoran biosynthesis glycosyltransferase